MRRLTIVCLSAIWALSAAPDAFGWGAVSGPRGGAAYRGPMGGAAVRGPYGGAATRGPYGGAAVRTPSGAAAVRGPYGGTAVRGPVYGGTVYRGTTVVTPGVGQQQADAPAKLKEFSKASAWDRRSIIEKGGWATVPGTDAPNSAVATACAERLGRLL